MSNGEHSLAVLTSLGKEELEDAYRLTFDDNWIETAEQAHGIQETLDYRRRLLTAVLATRTRESEEIVSAMEENEQKLRAALRDLEDAKQDGANVAGYIIAVAKVAGLFESSISEKEHLVAHADHKPKRIVAHEDYKPPRRQS